jgi:biopolymer transport protein ExbB
MTEDMIQQIRDLLALGGPVVAILLVLSVIALALILLKLVQFWRERVGFHGRSERAMYLWVHGNPVEARRVAEEDRSAVGAALATAMRLSMNRNLPRQIVEEEVGRVALGRLHELQRGFRALDAIAQISPLLGLFGTVLGMIEAFRQLQGAGSAVDPTILAGGIWVALLTTAAGLAVAMPVSLVLTWFETRVENERVVIETTATGFFSQTAMGDLRAAAGNAQPSAPLVAGPVHAH